MSRGKHSRSNRAAAAKNRVGRGKRRDRAAPPTTWEKQRAAEQAAQKADGIDPKVPASTWLPTEGRNIAEAGNTTLASLTWGHQERVFVGGVEQRGINEVALEEEVRARTRTRED